jgi:hypothetical protein
MGFHSFLLSCVPQLSRQLRPFLCKGSSLRRATLLKRRAHTDFKSSPPIAIKSVSTSTSPAFKLRSCRETAARHTRRC